MMTAAVVTTNRSTGPEKMHRQQKNRLAQAAVTMNTEEKTENTLSERKTEMLAAEIVAAVVIEKRHIPVIVKIRAET
jgi:hypothetical protein